MNTTATDTTVATQSLPATLSLGPVHLTVTDLQSSIDFYTRVIGMRLRTRDDDAGTAALDDGSGDGDVLVLVQQSDARAAGRHAGLYHVALLFPSRLELARVAARLAATRTPIQGASDHGTHEAFYLPDPDGNGLELAADRPREQWPDVTSADGYGGGPHPLDVADLMALVAGEAVQAHAAPGLAPFSAVEVG